MSTLELIPAPGLFALARFPSAAPTPDWVEGPGPTMVFRSADELAILAPQERVPDQAQAERDFRAWSVRGPLDFADVGILARLTGALADAGISIVAVSSFDTDWVLVKADRAAAAVRAWTARDILIRD